MEKGGQREEPEPRPVCREPGGEGPGLEHRAGLHGSAGAGRRAGLHVRTAMTGVAMCRAERLTRANAHRPPNPSTPYMGGGLSESAHGARYRAATPATHALGLHLEAMPLITMLDHH